MKDAEDAINEVGDPVAWLKGKVAAVTDQATLTGTFTISGILSGKWFGEAAPPEILRAGLTPDQVIAMTWAMVSTGELEYDANDGTLAASNEPPTLDIMAMLAAQPEIGTEEGLASDLIEAISLEPESAEPHLVPALSIRIFEAAADGGATRNELGELFEQTETEEDFEAALGHLLEEGVVDCVPAGEGWDADRYLPAGWYLDSLGDEELRGVYERETGEKAGKKGEKRLREEIEAVRAARAAKPVGDAAEGEDDDPSPEGEDDEAAKLERYRQMHEDQDTDGETGD